MTTTAWIETLAGWQAWAVAAGLVAAFLILYFALKPKPTPGLRRENLGKRVIRRIFGG